MSEWAIYLTSTIIAVAIAAGIIKNKIENLSKDVEELEERVYAFREQTVS